MESEAWKLFYNGMSVCEYHSYYDKLFNMINEQRFIKANEERGDHKD